jgi:hydrogenase-4 component B
LIGGLAVACFAKVFGAVFLGQARTADVERAHEVGVAMIGPMAVLASACLFIGLAAPLLSKALDAAVLAWAGEAGTMPLDEVAPLAWVSATSAVLLAAMTLVGCALTRRVRAARQGVGTWDCGYVAPSARMQYTSSSFAQMLVGLLAWVLRPTAHTIRVEGLFPLPGTFRSHVPDTVLDRVVVPAFTLIGRILAWLRPIQRGSIHLYLLYILGTLLVLLLWR